MDAKPKILALPGSVASRSDIARVLRELEALIEYLNQAVLRGVQTVELPPTSPQLNDIAEHNDYNLNQKDQLAALEHFLAKVKDMAPVVHMRFASKPSSEAVARIVEWLRSELSSYTLLEVGIQPSIVAGCQLRTTNKLFDFSLSKQLETKQTALTAKLQELRRA